MALRELVEGDCGGPGPFATLTSHLVQDRGFRDDGIGQAQNVPFENASAEQLVDEFLESRNNVHPQTFRMKDILHEIHEIDHNLQPSILMPQQQQQQQQQQPHDSEWANQFHENRADFYEHNTEKIWSESCPMPSSQLLTASSVSTTLSMGQDANELGLGRTWAEDYIEHTLESGKSETDELEILKGAESESPNIAFSKFIKFMNQDGEILVERIQNHGLTNFNAKWAQEFSEQQNPEGQTSITKDNEISNKIDDNTTTAGVWANEFLENASANIDSETYESSFWARLQGEWDKLSNKQITDSHPWISEYESYYDPFKDYKFHENNPMKNSSDALEQGRRRLEAGDLPSAVLCFEAAVQQDPENAEGWLLLGKTQAENEQDPLAISALKKCLTLEPSNETALMTLAVSYTNESYQNQACLTLKEWLMKNNKYNHLLVSRNEPNLSTGGRSSSVSTILFNDVHNEVKDLFIQAARMNPTNEIDADVQSGLGVLFNLSSEFEKAADCFRAALQVRPDDCRLWNRLGASLANGQKSEEAVDAYSRALELSPGFIRARYNLGISCINLGVYKEAAEHLLTALNQQAAGRGIEGQGSSVRAMSETIWSTLRLVMSLMHKFHLNEAIENRDLAKLNEEFEMADNSGQ